MSDFLVIWIKNYLDVPSIFLRSLYSVCDFVSAIIDKKKENENIVCTFHPLVFFNFIFLTQTDKQS